MSADDVKTEPAEGKSKYIETPHQRRGQSEVRGAVTSQHHVCVVRTAWPSAILKPWSPCSSRKQCANEQVLWKRAEVSDGTYLHTRGFGTSHVMQLRMLRFPL